MKKVLSLLMCLSAITVYAQNSGLGFNYQAVVRNTNGGLLSDTDLNLRVSLYPGQEATMPTWVEMHHIHTDISGSFGINVGNGDRDPSSTVCNYTDVDFATIYYWLKIEIQEDNSYREVSFSRLPSSPYAEVAHNAILFPAGMISPFAGPVENIPYGWMLCDGSEISRTEYVNLYNAIGVCWGTGDGATTFNIPDLRGMFLRGVSGDSGNDADADKRIVLNDNGGNTGNQVGSYQSDAIRNITGSFSGTTKYDVSGAFEQTSTSYNSAWDHNVGFYHQNTSFDVSRVVPTGNDNRPKNVYVNYIIKY